MHMERKTYRALCCFNNLIWTYEVFSSILISKVMLLINSRHPNAANHLYGLWSYLVALRRESHVTLPPHHHPPPLRDRCYHNDNAKRRRTHTTVKVGLFFTHCHLPQALEPSKHSSMQTGSSLHFTVSLLPFSVPSTSSHVYKSKFTTRIKSGSLFFSLLLF